MGRNCFLDRMVAPVLLILILHPDRLDSYGAVRKPPLDDFPPELSSVFSGVAWTNVRKIITFVEKSSEISFSGEKWSGRKTQF